MDEEKSSLMKDSCLLRPKYSVLISCSLQEKTSFIHPGNKMLQKQSVLGRLTDISLGTIQMAVEEAEKRCVLQDA